MNAIMLNRLALIPLWLLTPAIRLMVHPSPRETIIAGFVAVGAALLLTISGSYAPLLIASYTTTFAITCFVIALMLGRRTLNRPVMGALVIYSLLLVAAIPLALYYETGQWMLTILLAEWAGLMILVYMARFNDHIWTFLSWGLIPHVILVSLDALYKWHINGRAVGYAENPNVAGGLIGFMSVYATLRGKWYALLPLMPVLALTGTRQAFWITVTLLLILAARRYIRWRNILLVFLVLVPAIWHLYPSPARLIDPGQRGTAFTEDVKRQFYVRITEPPVEITENKPAAYRQLFLAPQGDTGDHGVHSVALRIAYQAGLIGLVIYYGLSFKVLIRPRWAGSRWLMVLFLLLGVFDYYPIMPPFSLLWWLLIALEYNGLRSKNEQRPNPSGQSPATFPSQPATPWPLPQ